MPILGGLFGGRAEAGPIVIPVAKLVPVAFRVYYTPGYPPLLPEDLRAKTAAWVDANAEEPLRSALRPLVGSPEMAYTDMARTSFPPPLDVLVKADVGVEEKSRLEASWQVAVVACQARPQVPMLGLWAAIAAGRSAATELKGALFDAAAERLTPIASYQQGLPGRGVLAITDHARLSSTTDGRGMVRWYTAGLTKFGLPEIEIQEAPAGLNLEFLLRDLAQHLLDQLLTANQGRSEMVTQMTLGTEVNIPQAGGTARFRLLYTDRRGDLPPILDVLPTPDYRGSQALFLAAIAQGRRPAP